MASVMKISDNVDLENLDRPRERILLSKEKDLLIALNVYQPGANNEFHFHAGSSQSFLVLQGALTVRTMESDDSPVVESVLGEGECVLVANGEYYQLYNHTDAPALMYQVKHPGDRIVVLGKGALNNRDYFTPDRQAEKAL